MSSVTTFFVYIALIVVTLIVVPIIVHASYPFVKAWFFISNDYDAAYLTSTILTAVVTVIYVMFTYFIFYATNKTTQQTSHFQKIALVERKLELFYLPLKSALKRFDIDTVVELNAEVKCDPANYLPIVQIGDIWWRFKEDYNQIIPYTYLAINEEKINLTGFAEAFDSSKLFFTKCDSNETCDKLNQLVAEFSVTEEFLIDKYISKYLEDTKNIGKTYKDILMMVEDDITLLKMELNALVNQ